VNDLKQCERAQLLRIDDLKLEVLSEETKNKDKTLRLQDMKRAQEQLKYHLKTAKKEIDTITASTNATIDLLNQQVVKAKSAENRALDNCKNTVRAKTWCYLFNVCTSNSNYLHHCHCFPFFVFVCP
jgi:polyribonucleotide nucleotidyltransferase